MGDTGQYEQQRRLRVSFDLIPIAKSSADQIVVSVMFDQAPAGTY